ncbi:muscular LMNA-interacting protein isoform X11 [Protopterus annectens]|uniref:muscular LMNA-interacting protein isoform X11 n=1 Tax=Protopterus annectens TaxID=7888 RepID=UPI001CF93624|nr:muscular LMNA-interacting protein isoform X11 [Protopterus annectens]
MNLLKTDKGCKQSIMLCGHIKKHDKNEGQTSQVIKESLEDGDVKALNFTFVPKIRSLPAVHKVFVPNREVKPNQNVISASVKKIEQPTKNAWSSVAWHSQLEERSVKDKNMHQDGVFKAEIVYLGDSDGGDEDQKHLQSESKYYSPQEQTMLHSMYEPPLNYLQHIRSDCVPFTSIKTSEDKLLKEYKISSSYKTLAAVPTNKLLMEQKETDEPIQATEKSQSDQLRDMPYLETHSQLHSPSQLRQQSEELYATIDRVLQESTPRVNKCKHRSASVPTSQRRVLDSNGTKMARTLPGLAGRETKYAQLNSPPSASRERKQREEAACFGEHTRESTPLKTKPGVIRPVPIIIKQKEDNYQPNPFRKYLEENLDNDIQQLLNSGAKINKDDSHRIHGQQVPHAEKLKSTPCPIGKSELLLITEEPVDKSSKSYA